MSPSKFSLLKPSITELSSFKNSRRSKKANDVYLEESQHAANSNLELYKFPYMTHRHAKSTSTSRNLYATLSSTMLNLLPRSSASSQDERRAVDNSLEDLSELQSRTSVSSPKLSALKHRFTSRAVGSGSISGISGVSGHSRAPSGTIQQLLNSTEDGSLSSSVENIGSVASDNSVQAQKSMVNRIREFFHRHRHSRSGFTHGKRQHGGSNVSEQSVRSTTGISQGKNYRFFDHRAQYSEESRLDQEHYLLKLILGGRNQVAALDRNRRDDGALLCLDVGHGTGIWIMEMASTLSNYFFHGVDLQCRHPTTIIPPNCCFHQHDVFESGLPFAANTFNYIFQRNLLSSSLLQDNSLSAYIMELRRVITLDGILEIIESDYHLYEAGPAGEQINSWLLELLLLRRDRSTIPRVLWPNLEKELRNAGFAHLEQVTIRVPTGIWGGTIGKMSQANILIYLEQVKMDVVYYFGVCEEEFDFIVKKWEKELDQHSCYWELKIFLAKVL